MILLFCGFIRLCFGFVGCLAIGFRSVLLCLVLLCGFVSGVVDFFVCLV